MAVIEFHHPTDPRFAVIVEDESPDEITVEEAELLRPMTRTELSLYMGKNPVDFVPDVDFVYAQPGGDSTPWVRSRGGAEDAAAEDEA